MLESNYPHNEPLLCRDDMGMAQIAVISSRLYGWICLETTKLSFWDMGHLRPLNWLCWSFRKNWGTHSPKVAVWIIWEKTDDRLLLYPLFRDMSPFFSPSNDLLQGDFHFPLGKDAPLVWWDTASKKTQEKPLAGRFSGSSDHCFLT